MRIRGGCPLQALANASGANVLATRKRRRPLSNFSPFGRVFDYVLSQRALMS